MAQYILCTTPENVSDVGVLKIAIFLLVFIFEFAALIALLVIGGTNAYVGRVNKNCGFGSFGLEFRGVSLLLPLFCTPYLYTLAREKNSVDFGQATSGHFQ